MTFKRPTNYSLWHRAKLPSWCFMTDGDFFEQRRIDDALQTVAYVETIQVPDVHAAAMGAYPVFPSKDALCAEIQQKMGIPSYIVYHAVDCHEFLVYSYTDRIYKSMTEQEYINLVKNLAPLNQNPPQKHHSMPDGRVVTCK